VACWRRWISPRPSETSPLDVALRFLAQRPRSESEVRRRLRRAELTDEAIDTVVAQLKQHRLVDDAAFAQYWVEQRQTFRPRGARLLRAELRSHGVGTQDAQVAAASVEPSAEDDAYRAAQKRARHWGALDERTFRTKSSQFLARRGFGWDTISPVVERLYREISTS
jgi:regulatory protein